MMVCLGEALMLSGYECAMFWLVRSGKGSRSAAEPSHVEIAGLRRVRLRHVPWARFVLNKRPRNSQARGSVFNRPKKSRDD